MGLIFFQRQMYDEATRVYSILVSKSTVQAPFLAAAMAEHWEFNGHPEDAAAAAKRADPSFKRKNQLDSEKFWPTEAWYMIASGQEMTHDNLTISYAAFKRAVALNNNYLHAFHGLVHLASRLCIWDERDEQFERTRQLIKSGGVDGMGPIFALNYPITVAEVCAFFLEEPGGDMFNITFRFVSL